jgi:F-type H+-transporting ATPase subunit a
MASLSVGAVITVLLLTAYVSITSIGEIGLVKGLFGFAWLALALAIYMFEVIVILLQAYIFTLLSAVYIETSMHPQH